MGIPSNPEIKPTRERLTEKDKPDPKKEEATRKKEFKQNYPCYENFGNPKKDMICAECNVKGTCEARTNRKLRGAN